jgi:hypothetical protein
MKYEQVEGADGIEAIGAYSGYRVRMSLVAADAGLEVDVRVRGSESEEEVAVEVPHMAFRNASDAFDHGYEWAVLWIDAENKRIL